MSLEEKKKEKLKKILEENNNRKLPPNSLRHDKKFYDEISINKKGTFYDPEELKLINEENYIISKPNDLIQNTIFNFSTVELQCLNYSICRLVPENKFQPFEKNGKIWHLEFYLKDLLNALKLKGSNGEYANIKKCLLNIKKVQKEIKFIENGKTIQKPFNYFLDVEIEKDLKNDSEEEKEKNYKVRIQFDGNLLNSLQKTTTKFTELYQVYSSRLKHKYSIRMYELCKSWQSNYDKIHDCYGFLFYIDKAKKEWFIPESYEYKHIKANIIDKSILEINTKTDIYLKATETVKKDNKTIGVFIEITPNPNFIQIYQEMTAEREEFRRNKIKSKKDVVDTEETNKVNYYDIIKIKENIYEMQNLSYCFDMTEEEKEYRKEKKQEGMDAIFNIKQLVEDNEKERIYRLAEVKDEEQIELINRLFDMEKDIIYLKKEFILAEDEKEEKRILSAILEKEDFDKRKLKRDLEKLIEKDEDDDDREPQYYIDPEDEEKERLMVEEMSKDSEKYYEKMDKMYDKYFELKEKGEIVENDMPQDPNI